MSASRRGDFAFLVWIALCLGLSFPYAEATRNANERPRLLQAMSVVDGGAWVRGSWAIDGPAARDLEPGPDVARSQVDGRLYPNKPPGTTVVVAASYLLARAVHGESLTLRTLTWWARLASGWLPTVVLAWLLVARLRRDFDPAIAHAAVCAVVLGTPIAAYAHLAYGHALAAMLLFAGVTACVDAVVAQPRSTARAGVGGMLAGGAVAVEYGCVFAGLPLGLYLLAHARTRAKELLAAVAGACIPLAGLAVYHHAVFGSAFATGYHHVVDPEFARLHGHGLLGLRLPSWRGVWTHILDPGGGLLTWVPWAPLALVGFARGKPTVRPHRLVAGAVVVVQVFVVVSLSFEGGWRVGPRYLVAVLPFLAWGAAGVLKHAQASVGWCAIATALLTYAWVMNALVANLWPHLDLTAVAHPLPDVLLPLLRAGVEPYGMLQAGWLQPARSVVALSVMGSVLVAVRGAVNGLKPTRARTQVLACAAGVGAGVLLLVAVTYWPAHPRASANVAYILRVWEPPFVQSHPLRAVAR